MGPRTNDGGAAAKGAPVLPLLLLVAAVGLGRVALARTSAPVRSSEPRSGDTHVPSSAKTLAPVAFATGGGARAVLAAASPSAGPALAAPECDPPWSFDRAGIRRLRLACLEPARVPSAAAGERRPAPSRSECDPPWSIDAQGVRRIRSQCLRDASELDAAAAARERTAGAAGRAPERSSCDPPWLIDTRGIRRVQRQCLDSSVPAARELARQEPAASGSCDPPWGIDAGGIRRLRRKCL